MLRKILAAAVTAFTLVTASIASADYAAIAYSPSTGNYGYAYGFGCQGDAQSEAVNRCNASDARAVVWAENGWCALATGDNGTYGWGWATCQAEAENIALSNCTNGHIVARAFSGTSY